MPVEKFDLSDEELEALASEQLGKRYRILDPVSGKEHTLNHMDMWRLTFGATASYCHDVTKGMVGVQKRTNMAQCMVAFTRGVPTESHAQYVINLAKFPVDEYIERLEARRTARALPFYPEVVV